MEAEILFGVHVRNIAVIEEHILQWDYGVTGTVGHKFSTQSVMCCSFQELLAVFGIVLSTSVPRITCRKWTLTCCFQLMRA